MMIMAGRGRRLLNTDSETKSVGVSETLQGNSSSVSLVTTVKKIQEVNLRDINPSLLSDIQNDFKQLFTSKKVLREILSDLHEKALSDAEFGEKLVVTLEQFSNFEIDGVGLRSELLSFIQNDFKIKETTAQSDPKKFLNSVILLGSIYNKFKVCGAPIAILGIALLEYFDLLLKGSEEEFKTLAKQILINGKKLSNVNNYELLMQSLRNTLIIENLSSCSKCWLLLAIDFISNDFNPLNKVLDDFYVNQLAEEYVNLMTLGQVFNEQNINSDYLSFDCPKNENSSSLKKKNPNVVLNETDVIKKDLSKKLSEMNIKPEIGVKSKVLSPPGKNFKKDSWKPRGGKKENSGHDDRFEKDENFYGVQKPRQTKPENQRKKFHDFKGSEKGFDNFKIEIENRPETHPKAVTEGS